MEGWTATRAGYTDKLNVPGTLTHTGNVATAPANLADLKITPSTGQVDMGAVAGTAVTGPDDLKADVSNIAADAATAVWAAGTRTLTGFGTLVADIATAVWSATARTLTAFGFTAGANVTQVGGQSVSGPDDLKADVSALALEATVGALNDLSSADAQAAATAALNAYDPPTKAELDTAVSPLALEATLAAIKGAGWTDETLAAIKAAVDAIGSGGDATAANQTTIIGHLTDIKGATWSTETLVALKTLLDALPTAEAIDTELTTNHGEGSWGSATSGINSCEYTFVDTNGAVVGNTTIAIWTDVDGEADTLITVKATNSSGVLSINLDDGVYHLINASSSALEGEDNSVTVSGASSATITITANNVAPPEDESYCRVFCYAREIDGSIPSSGTLSVERVHTPATTGTGAATVTIVLGESEMDIDAEGYAYIDILQGAKIDMALRTNGSKVPLMKYKVTVPSTTTANWESLT